MDKVYLRDLIWALKAELIRFRIWFVSAFIAISFALLFLGFTWPKTYSTSAMLYADMTNIIEPLLKGSAEVTKIDRSEQAREVIYTRGIIETAAKERGLIKKDTSPEQQDKIIRGIRSGLSVLPEKNNNYFRLSFKSNDPDKAFEMLNTVINVFIQDTEKKKRDESSTAYNFIDAQVQSYKHQLELAEEKLKEFNAQNVDGSGDSVANRINSLRSDIEMLKINIEESQSRITTLEQQLGSEGQYQHAKGQVDDMKQRRQAMQAQLENLLLTYQDDYPDVVSLKAQIAELDAAMRKVQTSGDVYAGSEKVVNPLYEEIRKQLATAQVDLKAQKRKMETLVALREQEKSRAEKVASNQAEFAELTRDYNVTKNVYEQMLQKKEAARLSMTLDIEGQGVSYRIQEPASFPIKPSGLAFLHFAIMAPFIGMLIPIALLIAYVMLDPHIRSARLLQKQLPKDLDLLGAIPHYNSPLGERLLRKDVLALLIVCAVSMALYIAIAIYWQLFKA